MHLCKPLYPPGDIPEMMIMAMPMTVSVRLLVMMFLKSITMPYRGINVNKKGQSRAPRISQITLVIVSVRIRENLWKLLRFAFFQTGPCVK
jgi:ABC-type microcin C transport system permease subunit YejB